VKVVLTVYGAKAYSGLPKYFYFLAKHLVLNDVDVEVVLDSEERLERLGEITQGVPINYHVVGPAVTNIASKATYAYNIARYLKDKDFDILHSCDVLPYFYLKHRDRKPVVHQPFSSELFQIGGGDIRRFFYFVLRNCGQKADALAVVGEWQLDDTLKAYRVSRDKTFILPVGIDLDYVRNLASEKSGIRKRLGIPKDKYVVLSVNILQECKGINYLVEAMKDVPNALLVITSSGPEEKNLRRMVLKLGLLHRVIFTGDVAEKDLYDYYMMADVYVHPTLLNGSSMGIMEAEAFGLPIVSTHQEFLIDGNGYVVPEKNPKALAEAILKVRNGDRAKMGEISKEIVKQYDFKEIAKTAIAKYEELIK